jgi:LEA14-like dessication related protein
MYNTRPAYLLSIIVLLMVIAFGCATLPGLSQPEIKAIHPRITGIDFQGVNLDFDVDVNNPYFVPIRTPRFRYGLDVEGSKFFESETTTGIDLPAHGVGTAVLPVRLTYADLLRSYRSLSGAPEADYKLYGALMLSALGQNFELPVSHQGKFPILRPPTFSDIKIKPYDISLAGAKLEIQTRVKNPNAFSVGLNGLGYTLQLGNVRLGGLTATTLNTLQAGEEGRMSLSGELSAANGLFNLLIGGTAGEAKIVPSGFIKTPYGAVNFQQDK